MAAPLKSSTNYGEIRRWGKKYHSSLPIIHHLSFLQAVVIHSEKSV